MITAEQIAAFKFPDWVPPKIQEDVAEFWSHWDRTPASYEENRIRNQAPATGTYVVVARSDDPKYATGWAPISATKEVAVSLLLGQDGDRFEGRYVHAWNNMGRLVLHEPDEQGRTHVVVSVHELRERATIDPYRAFREVERWLFGGSEPERVGP